MRRILFSSVFSLLFLHSDAQEPNPIITAFPSLKISASSRGLGMGNCGIASADDNQQLFYNVAKSAFTTYQHKASVTYSPYLTGISKDIKFLNANYLTSLSSSSTLAVSLNYLSLGWNASKDDNGAIISISKAAEYNLTGSYAIKLTGQSSLGVSFKFLVSQPTQIINENYTTAGKNIFSVAADVSYYNEIPIKGNESKLHFGAVISNLGPKVFLAGSDPKTFLPTNLGFGLGYSHLNMATNGRFTVGLDINKLLVPTPPNYDGNRQILAGKDPNIGVLRALFSSFTDAPGGLKEELREIRISGGLEYTFYQQFSLRGGISVENVTKGNRNFLGFGVGYSGIINDQAWGMDFHYLVPLKTVSGVSPYQNSWGVSLKLAIRNLED